MLLLDILIGETSKVMEDLWILLIKWQNLFTILALGLVISILLFMF